jgi:hypothetical protein
MTDKIEVRVKVGEKEVTLVGPESFVRAEVQRLTNLLAGNVPSGVLDRVADARPQLVQGELPVSEREFVAQKGPSGHPEIVAVLAYFLAQSGQAEFTAEDIKRAYLRAGVRPPKVVAQALRDAKNTGDYLERGSDKGKFRLTTHGERVVQFDLPRREKPHK